MLLEEPDRVAPGLGADDDHVVPFQHAGQGENVADVIVHDQDLLPGERLGLAVQLLQDVLVGVGELAERTVEHERGLIHQGFR